MRVNPKPFQEEAVAHHIRLLQDRGATAEASVPGFGKTYVAAFVAREVLRQAPAGFSEPAAGNDSDERELLNLLAEIEGTDQTEMSEQRMIAAEPETAAVDVGEVWTAPEENDHAEPPPSFEFAKLDQVRLAPAPEPIAPELTGLERVVDAINRDVASSSEDSDDALNLEEKQETSQRIVFQLDGTRYAVPIGEVLELSTVPKFTPLPNVPDFVRGVTNLRGEVLAVIDLRILLGIRIGNDIVRERMLVVRPPGTDSIAGLIVDSVRGLIRISNQDLREPAGPLEDPVMNYLAGVTEFEDQVLHALDLRKLFRAPEIGALSSQ